MKQRRASGRTGLRMVLLDSSSHFSPGLPQCRVVIEGKVDTLPGSGVDFIHVSGMTDAKLFPTANGSGVAIFDFDNDGNPSPAVNGEGLFGSTTGEGGDYRWQSTSVAKSRTRQ
jgi:hypothetical protein